jgi:Flp pilus assembly protein TadD
MRHLLAVLLLFLAGCATAPPRSTVPAELFADASFARPATQVGSADLFTLSPEMRSYLHSPAFSNKLRTMGRERGLIEALYSKGELKLDYDSTYTRTAAETFRDRVGNCLSLVVMTAAFAKELGMTVHYQSLDVESWSRSGGLYLLSGHVNIVIGARQFNDAAPSQALVVDFIPDPQLDRTRAHGLTEEALVAMFLNNRAAEALVQGRLDDAYWWSRAAVTANPASALPLNTLGVVYDRHGDKGMAERVYRAALAREPENLASMNNLQPVLAALGKTEEAQALARRIASLEPVPPFHYFDQGVAAYRQGDFGKARELFMREVKRAPYNDEFHFWLAASCVQLGRMGEAKEQLALAADTSTQNDTRQLYSAKLSHLRQLGMR